MSGRVVHFEIPYADGDKAREFYRAAFGWTVTEPPGMSYALAATGPTDDSGPTEPGFINGGLLRRESPDDSPIVVIEVDDIDTSLAKIEELGGATVLAKQPVGEIGHAAYFKDVDGNIMGLWQSA
jgi:predicted enzyme related to lactoylglutathione lyase